jgi:hypothetical protein
MIKVQNIRRLTTKDIEDIENQIENVREEDIDAFDIILACHLEEDGLEESNYIIGDVTLDRKYTFIHGFPGDEPCGLLFSDDFTIVRELHWSADKGVDPLDDWFLDSYINVDDELEPPDEWVI